jgi:hypothetical protein
MVVARNHPLHIGKLVRQVHHFYRNEKRDEDHMFIAITVNRSEAPETKGAELLELHPDDLEYVKESMDE